jgi:hypothetical protein
MKVKQFTCEVLAGEKLDLIQLPIFTLISDRTYRASSDFLPSHSVDLRGTFSEVHFSLIYLAATISPGAGVIVRDFEVRDFFPVIGHIDVRGREFPEVLKSVQV